MTGQDRVCLVCEVGWRSHDTTCWNCGQPGELKVVATLLKITSHRGYEPAPHHLNMAAWSV
jgi:predicted amidophosphoribosyltransferase